MRANGSSGVTAKARPPSGGPVPHRPSCRRSRFGCRLVGGEDSDDLVDVQRFVVGEAGVGLPGQSGGGVQAQRPDGQRKVSPLVDRREQRRVERLVVDGLRRAAGVVTGDGDRLGFVEQVRHTLVADLGVQDAAPPHQCARPAQHRIGRRPDDVLGAAVVGDGRDTAGDVQLSDGQSGELPVRDCRLCSEDE